MDFDKFVTNIYDPRQPDADDKLVSANIDPEKRESMLKFIRDWINEHDIGEPCETYNANLETLKANNVVGLYRNDNTKSMGALSLLGDHSVKVVLDENEEQEKPKKKHPSFFRRRKSIYKPPENYIPPPKDTPTIEDYVPPAPRKDND